MTAAVLSAPMLESICVPEWKQYYVDQSSLRALVAAGEAQDAFAAAWESELEKVERFYRQAVQDLMTRHFKQCAALRDEDFMKLQAFAAANRKDLEVLAQWYDRAVNPPEPVTWALLPRLYAASLSGRVLTDLLKALPKRHDNVDATQACTEGEQRQRAPVVKRKDPSARLAREVQLLRKLKDCVPEANRRRLVAHRGFHSTRDDTDRPVENTLPAFEQAWAAGITHCECDISITLDGHLVLNHDDDTTRLELLKGKHSEAKAGAVTTRTFAEIVQTPLISGCRPPKLREVLQVARELNAAGVPAKMVVEIKSEPQAPERAERIVVALLKMITEKPWLVSTIACIMSFDIHVLRRLATELSDLRSSGRGPMLLLLTVSRPWGEGEHEIYLNRPGGEEKLVELLDGGDNEPALDGAYMEWYEGMAAEQSESVRRLSQRYSIGVWQSVGQPDCREGLDVWSSLGVQYVNSDLPRNFLTTASAKRL